MPVQAQLPTLEALQPFMNLVQSNMDLLSRYALSPEIATETLRSMQAMFSQGPAAFPKLAESQAFFGLVQGLMKNYTEFLTELSQSSYGAMFQGPLALMQQMQAASGNIFDLAGRGSKGR